MKHIRILVTYSLVVAALFFANCGANQGELNQLRKERDILAAHVLRICRLFPSLVTASRDEYSTKSRPVTRYLRWSKSFIY